MAAIILHLMAENITYLEWLFQSWITTDQFLSRDMSVTTVNKTPKGQRLLTWVQYAQVKYGLFSNQGR